MKCTKATLFALSVLVLLPRLASTAPEIRASPSRSSVQRGGVFDLRLEITAREPLSTIAIVPLVPFGFHLEPIPSSGIIVEKDEKSTSISKLAQGSSMTVLYRARPPSLWGKRRGEDGRGPVSTAEQKVFAFNVFYTVQEDSLPASASQTITTTIQYTTSFGYYLFWGLVGMVLGHLVKNGTRQRETLQTALAEQAPSRGTFTSIRAILGQLLKTLLGTNITGFITILVVGFGALLVLARDGIPIAGWHQAVALGFGLAVLTDDELLAKFSVSR